MDEFFKNNPNAFQNINIDPKHSSFKERDKNIKINNINQINNSNQSRGNYKNSPSIRSRKQNKPNAFIIGKFGKKTVVSQDLSTFLNKIKQAEWTTNTSYLLAKDINIKPIFTSYNSKDDYNISYYANKIDKYYLHLNEINFNDFTAYVNEIKNRNNRLNQDAKKEKQEFIRANFPNEGKVDLNSILNRIRNNYQSFIEKDQILYNKISQAMQHKG
jgi:hypothetical protein